MRKLITESSTSEIHIDSLTGKEIVAYRSNNPNGSIVVLTQLKDKSYGFVHLAYTNTQPAFVKSTWRDAIKLAAVGRKVYIFNTMEDFFECAYKKLF